MPVFFVPEIHVGYEGVLVRFVAGTGFALTGSDRK